MSQPTNPAPAPSFCPTCGASLSAFAGTPVRFCPYCGASIEPKPRPQPQPEPQPEPLRRTQPKQPAVGVEADGTIRDRSSGRGLFWAQVPDGWRVTATALRQTGSGSQPYVPHAELRDEAGGVVRFTTGDAGLRPSAAFKGALSMYGSNLAGVDRTNYAEMPDPLALVDAFIAQQLAQANATGLRLVEQVNATNLEELRGIAAQSIGQRIAAEGMQPQITDSLAASVLRIYEASIGGALWKVAGYGRLFAVKPVTPFDNGGAGIASVVGSLFGGGQQASQPSMQAQAQQALSRGATWCSPDFPTFAQAGTISWVVDLLGCFIAPAGDFDAAFGSEFLPMLGSVEVHADVNNLIYQYAAQQSGAVQQQTSATLARNQAAFQAQQAAHRQVQAAFDSYNQSITDARNAQYEALRASTNAQFSDASGGGPGDFSEAIRGVNTFVTSDGREVELSVNAERAYENQAGDVIGGSGGFDPGADWTQIPQK